MDVKGSRMENRGLRVVKEEGGGWRIEDGKPRRAREREENLAAKTPSSQRPEYFLFKDS
jgi:hypothetical protein